MKIVDRDVVAAHIYSCDGKIFMARNTSPASGVVYGDCWKIPGGGVELGETNEQALAREVREETGIDLAGAHVELVDDSMTGEAEKRLRETNELVLVRMRFFIYKGTLDKCAAEIPIVLDQHEFDEYRWFALPELSLLKLPPPSVECFKKLGLLGAEYGD